MTILIQPVSVDTLTAATTRAMPHFSADRLLEDAWADPWLRANARRTAETLLPGTRSLDDGEMLATIQDQLRRGVLTITGTGPVADDVDPGKGKPSRPRQYPAWITAFEQGKGNGAFPNIPRQQVALGLRRRTETPSLINQRDTSLCGPSSLCYNLLLDNPDAYVRYVIDLYETGAAMLGTTKVKPGQSCRNYRPKGVEVAPATSGHLGGPSVAVSNNAITGIDWVSTASLRDSENLMFAYDDPSDEFGGITLPNNLASWMEGLGYTAVTNETNVWFSKGPDTFQDAVRLLQQGQRVCIFVNARIVDGHATESHFYSVPDHWIVLDASRGVTNGKLAARFWTWGRYVDVPKMGQLDADTFCGNFFGYVAGKPPT